MAERLTSGSLVDWLDDEREVFAPVLAARVFLRVLPVVLREEAVRAEPVIGLTIFRSALFCWASQNLPSNGYAEALSRISLPDYLSIHASGRPGIMAAHHALTVCRFYAFPDNSAAVEAEPLLRTAEAVLDAGNATAQENVGPVSQIAYDEFWNALEDDCAWLDRQHDRARAARKLTHRKLWPVRGPSRGVQQAWSKASDALMEADHNFDVWLDWYTQRLWGSRSAFLIPGDAYRKEDKAILRKLADANDAKFWGRGVAYVNATLSDWLDDARERARERQGQEDEKQAEAERILDNLLDPKDTPPIPTQSPNALNFGHDDEGKIHVDASAGADALKADPDSRDRYEQAVAEARDLLGKCRTSNAGARLTALLSNYLDAAGDRLETMRPSLLVQRGEKLRQEVTAYAAPDSMLDPISDELLIDLKGWRSAHNMLVALQPRLNALDTALLGPDAKPALFPPDDLRMIGRDAADADILAEGVLDVIEEAADIAPKTPDASDRRTIWSVETGKNLIIEAFSVALNHPWKSMAAVAAVGMVAAEPATAIVAGVGAIGFLLRHRAWIENKLGDTPTWRALFTELCDRLKGYVPEGDAQE